MGKVTLKLIDNDGGFEPLIMEFDELGFDPQGSVPSEVGKEYKRELVKHPIPLLDRDIGQDMGAHSREYPFSGLMKEDIRDGLEARFLVPQITVSSPSGRWTVIYTNRMGVAVLNQSGLAMESYNWSYVPAMPDWFRYTLRFVEFKGQT